MLQIKNMSMVHIYIEDQNINKGIGSNIMQLIQHYIHSHNNCQRDYTELNTANHHILLNKVIFSNLKLIQTKDISILYK